MRACYVLLMAATTILACSNAAVTGSDPAHLATIVSGDAARSIHAAPVDSPAKRALRAVKTDDDNNVTTSDVDADGADSEDEERSSFDVSKLTKALNDDHYAKQLVKRWYKKDKLDDTEVAAKLGIDLQSFNMLEHEYSSLYWKFFNYRAQKLEKLRNRAGTSRK